MGSIISGNFSKHLDGDVTNIFFNEYGSYETQFDKIPKIIKAPPGGHFTEAELSSIGALQEKPEGTGIVYDTPVEGNEVTRYYTTYALGFQITKEMLADDLQRNFMKMPRELGKSAAYKRETEFFDLFNNGFANHTAWDGKAIFYYDGSTHRETLKSGDNMDNAPSTAAELSYSSLQSALEYGMKCKDSAGRPVPMKPWLLIIPPELYFTAKNLQLAEFEPGSGDNDVNVVRNEGWQYFVSPHITDSKYWFVLFKDHDFRFLWKEKVAIESADDFNTGNRLYKATMRFSTFCNNPLGCYGTTGD